MVDLKISDRRSWQRGRSLDHWPWQHACARAVHDVDSDFSRARGTACAVRLYMRRPALMHMHAHRAYIIGLYIYSFLNMYVSAFAIVARRARLLIQVFGRPGAERSIRSAIDGPPEFTGPGLVRTPSNGTQLAGHGPSRDLELPALPRRYKTSTAPRGRARPPRARCPVTSGGQPECPGPARCPRDSNNTETCQPATVYNIN